MASVAELISNGIAGLSEHRLELDLDASVYFSKANILHITAFQDGGASVRRTVELGTRSATIRWCRPGRSARPCPAPRGYIRR